jgi:phosphoadenosine phosphosulfate reductase
MVYWCNNCEIPIFENTICPLCGQDTIVMSSSNICNPVYYQERKLISYIINKDVCDSNIWYLGGGAYFINGNRIRLPFREFFKSKEHFSVSKNLREDIVVGDEIINAEEFVSANKRYMISKVFEAEEYTSSLITECTNDEENTYIPTVSFSGGKDSTVVSRLVRDAVQQEAIIHYFGDTTLEFPSTYKYVKEDFREENPIPPMLPSETENDFFKLCNVFGPPSKFERWCCTIFKTSNLNAEFQDLKGNSLTFLGVRRSESNERQNYERTQKKSKIGSQINAMPIIGWLDYDVWLYILMKKLLFNDAYRYGYKRVGCWCCPNNSDWATMLTDIYYPKLAEKWKRHLYDFALKTGKTDIDDYIENGKWKARRGASGLDTRNVTIKDTPCNLSDRARNIIIKKRLRRGVIEFLKPFGQLEIFDKDDATYISIVEREIVNRDGGIEFPKRKLCDVIITFGTTVLKVLPAKGTDALLLVTRIKCQLRKYMFCIRCTACDSVCPYGAINTMGNDRYSIIENKCKQNLNECSKCIAKFYNGCITCKVLAGKKSIPDTSSDL